MHLLCWRRTPLAWGTNEFCNSDKRFSDKRFSAGDERVENTRSNFSHTHTTSYSTSDFQTELMSK